MPAPRTPGLLPWILLGGALVSGALARPSPFAALPQDHWVYPTLQRVLDSDQVEGYEGPFHGGRALTRHELAQVLREVLRALPAGQPPPVTTRLPLRRLAGELSHELAMLDLPATEVAGLLGGGVPPPAPRRAAAVAAAAPPAPPPPAPPPAPAPPGVEAQGKLKLSGQLWFRPEYNTDNDNNSQTADSRDFTVMRTSLKLDWKPNDTYSGVIDLRDARTFGQERGAAGIGGNTITNQGNVDLYEGYVDYHPDKAKDRTLRMGRQALVFGDQRLVGALDWTNYGRAFDGLRYTTKRGKATVDLLWMTVADLTLAAAGATGRDDQDLFGVHSTWKLEEHSLDLYMLGFKDRVQLNARSQTGIAGAQDFWTYGLRAKGPLARKRLDYTLEVARQSGDFSTDSLEAWASALVLGRNLDPKGRDRVELEFDYSPGDRAALGERHTFQNLFPTNHIHYGIADRMSWQNMRALRLTLKHTMERQRNLRFDLWKFDLDDTRDAWYNAGSAVIRPGMAGAPRDLGYEADFRYTWKDGPMQHQIGVARLMAGDFQQFTSPTRAKDDSVFAYWWAKFAF